MRRLPVLLVLPLAGGALLAPPAQAQDAGPSVVLEPTQRYVVGTQVEHTDPEFRYWSVPGMQFRWRASSPSGICRQRVTRQNYNTLGGPTDPVLGEDTVTREVPPDARSVGVGFPDSMDYQRGSNRAVVRVTDCRGRTTTSDVAQAVVSFVEDASGRLSYRGAWATARFPGFTMGTTRWTDQAGASVTTQVQGGPVALVMEKAADRGSADVFVDGVRRARVDTASATTQHRRIVWETRLAPGTHTVRVVNAGTPGHPRIDLDALLVP